MQLYCVWIEEFGAGIEKLRVSRWEFVAGPWPLVVGQRPKAVLRLEQVQHGAFHLGPGAGAGIDQVGVSSR